MPSEIYAHLAAAAAAATQQVIEAETTAAEARRLLDRLNDAAKATPLSGNDTSVQVIRRYVDEHGRHLTEMEIELDDDLAAMPEDQTDPSAHVAEALRRVVNRSALGRHAYYRQLNTVAAEFGVRACWGSELDAWMDHHPEPPGRLTADILAAHAEWLLQRPSQAPEAANRRAEVN
jgi:hypothetical protein